MPGGLGPRFLIEAGFLIAVAVAAGLAQLDAIWIIVVMAGAWLLMAAKPMKNMVLMKTMPVLEKRNDGRR